MKSYCSSLEEEELKGINDQKNRKVELQEMIEKLEEHHRLTVLNRLTLVYRPNETVIETLSSQYGDDSIAYIEDIVIGSEIPMPIIESLFESVLIADVKPIMIPTPKRKLRQSDPKEDHEDPDSSDQEVVNMRVHCEPDAQSRKERSKSRSPRRPKVTLNKAEKIDKSKQTASYFKNVIAGNYDRLSEESKEWHESLVRDIPHTPKKWKYEFAKQMITDSFLF